MSAMEIDNDLPTVLASLRQDVENPELAQGLYQLEDFYERKLWNQLTLELEQLYSIEDSKKGNFRAKIFNQFLTAFQNKLNPISVVDFLLQSFDSPQECLDKLQDLKESLVADLTKKYSSRRLDNVDEIIANDEAIVYVSLQIARNSLLLGQFARADEILDSLSDKFDNTLQNDFSSKINAAFYLTKCQNFKIRENYNLFYTTGLLYLSSIENPMSLEEQTAFCYDLCIAALLGDKIYNYGELILHDILKSIENSDNKYYWLYNLIQHLNSGQLEKFNECLDIAYAKSPQLEHNKHFLHEKIVIMSLLELISLKSTTEKKLQFSEISSVTGVHVDQVEYLIIKCFSLDLIKGFINQIDQVLVVTWLQPRILNLDQVMTLYNHLTSWESKVEKLAEDVHSSGGTVWAGV